MSTLDHNIAACLSGTCPTCSNTSPAFATLAPDCADVTCGACDRCLTAPGRGISFTFSWSGSASKVSS